jgi:hypothetical protein
MKNLEQEPAPIEVEIPRSPRELLSVCNTLEKKMSKLSKHELSSKSLEELITYLPREDPKKLKQYLLNKKAIGREAALNYSLGRISLKDDLKPNMEFKEIDLANSPHVRSTKSIIEARDLTERTVRETLGELHFYNTQYDYIPVYESDTVSIKGLGIVLETMGKIEAIRYALSEDNELATLVEQAKQNNLLPIKFPLTP